jgi:hypothetical protein
MKCFPYALDIDTVQHGGSFCRKTFSLASGRSSSHHRAVNRCCFVWVYLIKRHMWEWRYSSTILDLHTRLVVSFTPLQLHPRGKRPRYPLYRRLGEPQSRSRRYGKEKISYPCRESNPGRPARRPSLYQLNYSGYHRTRVLCLNYFSHRTEPNFLSYEVHILFS